jgi:hypothetical protein
MRRYLRLTAGLLIASACAFAMAACGGGGHSSFVPPPPPGPQALTFNSFTATPPNVTTGSTATLNWALSNPGSSSTSNVNLQAYISAQQITLSSVGQPGVRALGTVQTISAIPSGQSASGSYTVTIQPPTGVTPPSALFITIVATPSASSSLPNAAPNVQVQLN